MNLTVRLGARVVGTLADGAADTARTFAYAAEWLGAAERFALAPSLPLEPGAAAYGAAVDAYFANLLPEGAALEVAAHALGVSTSNLPALLVALGRDLAGAVSVHPEGVDPRARPDGRRPLPRAELAERIRGRERAPFALWDGVVRVPLAGASDKIAVYAMDGEWCFADGGRSASTHLLKPEPLRADLAGLTTNEHFCLELARAVGVPAAESRLVQLPEPVLEVRRFDRRATPEHVQRRHVIDGCQALGLPVAWQYERAYGRAPLAPAARTGASYAALFARLDAEAARPLLERRALLRLALFNVLIGNGGATAKNVSFYASAAGLAVAPAYDLVSRHGLAAPPEDDYALAVGGAFGAGELSPAAWAEFAHAAGFTARRIEAELTRLAQAIEAALAPVGARVAAAGGAPATLERLCAGIAADLPRLCATAAPAARGRN